MKQEVSTSRRDLRALDSTNFFLADVETGIGPFIATYLSSANGWNPVQIGLVSGAQNLAAVLAQTPAGLLIDRSRHKTLLVALGAVVLSVGSLLVVHAKSVSLQVLNQAAVGVALAFILPAVTAISLGLVGKAALSPRIGRNAMFTHIGNTLTAVLAGGLAHYGGQTWIFYLSAMLGIFALLSALSIRTSSIDNDVARASAGKHEEHAAALASVLRQPAIVAFLALVVLFHATNASLLPLAGQRLSATVHGASGTYMAACVLLGQAVMIPVALITGKMADKTGRKPLFLLAFSAVALRGILFAVTENPFAVVAIEALDGLGTALAGVTTVLVISDLAQGTGRFNFLQGTAQAALGFGAFFGKVTSGWLAKDAGFRLTFSCLAGLAVIGCLLFWLNYRETANAFQVSESPQRPGR